MDVQRTAYQVFHLRLRPVVRAEGRRRTACPHARALCLILGCHKKMMLSWRPKRKYWRNPLVTCRRLRRLAMVIYGINYGPMDQMTLDRHGKLVDITRKQVWIGLVSHARSFICLPCTLRKICLFVVQWGGCPRWSQDTNITSQNGVSWLRTLLGPGSLGFRDSKYIFQYQDYPKVIIIIIDPGTSLPG